MVPDHFSTSGLGGVNWAPREEREPDSTSVWAARHRGGKVVTDKVFTDKVKEAIAAKGELGVKTGTGDEPQKAKKMRKGTATNGLTVAAEAGFSEVKLERRRERGRERGAASTFTRRGSAEALPAAYGGIDKDACAHEIDRQGERGSDRWIDGDRERERERETLLSGSISNGKEFTSRPNADEKKSSFASWDLGLNSTISMPPALFPPFPSPPSQAPSLKAEKEENKTSVKMDRDLDSSRLLKSEISQAPVPTAWNATAVTKKWSTTF